VQSLSGPILAALMTIFYCLRFETLQPGGPGPENVSSIIACSLFARETCPQSCFLATAVVLWLIYTADTWRWVYMSQYANVWTLNIMSIIRGSIPPLTYNSCHVA
jgi:hypothetical protein